MFNLVSTRTPMSFAAKLLFSCVTPSMILVQNFALFVELNEDPVSPFLQPVEVPLDSSMMLWHIHCSS